MSDEEVTETLPPDTSRDLDLALVEIRRAYEHYQKSGTNLGLYSFLDVVIPTCLGREMTVRELEDVYLEKIAEIEYFYEAKDEAER